MGDVQPFVGGQREQARGASPLLPLSSNENTTVSKLTIIKNVEN